MDFFLLCIGVIKWKNCRNTWSRRKVCCPQRKKVRDDNEKKSAQKKRNWKNRATLIVFERIKWIQAENAFHFLSPLAGCFVFDGKLWRRPCRVFSTVYFSSENGENSSFVHGLYQFVSPHGNRLFVDKVKYFRLSQRMKSPVGSDRIHWHKNLICIQVVDAKHIVSIRLAFFFSSPISLITYYGIGWPTKIVNYSLAEWHFRLKRVQRETIASAGFSFSLHLALRCWWLNQCKMP